MTSESEGSGAMQWTGAVDGTCREIKRSIEVNGMCVRKKRTRVIWDEIERTGMNRNKVKYT